MKPVSFRRSLITLLLAPCWMLLSAAARAQAPENETDSLYLGNRVMLVSGVPRQLTLNAQIQDFAWSPTGREIAYISHPGPNISDATLCIARREGGRPRIYYATHSDPETGGEDPASGAIRDLAGWSPDGNYLAFIAVAPVSQDGRQSRDVMIVDLARGDVSSVALPAWDDDLPQAVRAFWSPKRDLLALSAIAKIPDGPRLFIEDPAMRQTHPLTTPGRAFDLRGWSDDGKIVVLQDSDGPLPPPLQIDAQTGVAAPAPDAVVQSVESRAVYGYAPARLSAGQAGMISLQAGAAPETVKDPAGKPHRESVTLWALVEADKAILPFTRQFDPKASQGLPSVLRVDTYRTFAVWHEDTQTFGPPRDMMQEGGRLEGYQAAFAHVSPRAQDRAQIAYLISGDLYVSDITVRAPSVQELIAAGETLTCPEEQKLALINAKQIGLGLLQYTQDYDNHLPMADGFSDELYPYLRTRDLFTVAKTPFQFLRDGENLEELGTPAEEPVGVFKLPCGNVVLYADGHAKIEKNDENPLHPFSP